MTLPDFVGCGAGKSGTTSLVYYLNQHPGICMSPRKETDYFSANYENGVTWYEAHFRTCARKDIVGEFSPTYLVHPDAPERMAKLLPHAKLLFLLRNPVERAYSSYWFSVSMGYQSQVQPFSEAIRSELGSAMHVADGLYYRHLARYLEHFSEDQILVLFSEELRARPLDEIARCFRFLDVDPAFVPDVSQAYNVTGDATAVWNLLSYKHWTDAKNRARRLILWLPGSVRKAFARLESGARGRLFGTERPPMPDADRRYLRDIYAQENEQLATLLGRPLPWD